MALGAAFYVALFYAALGLSVIVRFGRTRRLLRTAASFFVGAAIVGAAPLLSMVTGRGIAGVLGCTIYGESGMVDCNGTRVDNSELAGFGMVFWFAIPTLFLVMPFVAVIGLLRVLHLVSHKSTHWAKELVAVLLVALPLGPFLLLIMPRVLSTLAAIVINS